MRGQESPWEHKAQLLWDWRCQPWAGWVRPAPCLLSLDASVPNVQVTKLTLMCEQAPGPITMDLTGERRRGISCGGREEEEGVPG